MHRAIWSAATIMAVVAVSPLPAPAQDALTGPNKILKAAKVGGEGGFDYIFADVEARRLYTPRSGAMGHLAAWNLDTLEPVGDIAGVKSGGAGSIQNPITAFPPPNLSPCGIPTRCR